MQLDENMNYRRRKVNCEVTKSIGIAGDWRAVGSVKRNPIVVNLPIGSMD